MKFREKSIRGLSWLIMGLVGLSFFATSLQAIEQAESIQKQLREAHKGDIIKLSLFGDVLLSDYDQLKDELSGKVADKKLGPLELTNGKLVKKGKAAAVGAVAELEFDGLLFGKKIKVELTYEEALEMSAKAFGRGIYKGTLSSGDPNEGGQKMLSILGVNLEEATILFDNASRKIEIQGEMGVRGLRLNAKFLISPPAWSDEPGVQFNAWLGTAKNIIWQPFKGSSIKDLSSIIVKNIKIGVKGSAGKNMVERTAAEQREAENEAAAESGEVNVSSAEIEPATQTEITITDPEAVAQKNGGKLSSALYFSGDTTLLNTDVRMTLVTGISNESGLYLTAIAELPKGWKLSQSFPELFPVSEPNGPKKILREAFDQLKFDDVAIILASRDGTHGDRAYKQGFNLTATLSMGHKYDNLILDVLKGLLIKEGLGTAGFLVSGSFMPSNPRSLELKVGVSAGSFGFKAGPASFYGGAVSLFVNGEPSLGLEGTFKMKPNDQKDSDGKEPTPLEFGARFSFTPVQFQVSGSMRGVWKNPFGIPHLEIGDLGLQGAQSYETLVTATAAAAATFGVGSLTALIPANLGLSGKLQIGDDPYGYETDLFISLGKNVTQFAIFAEVKAPLTLSQILNGLFSKFKSPIRIPEILPLHVRQAKIHFAPLGASVGLVSAKQGVGASGYITIFGKDAHLDIGLDLDRGAAVKGKIPAIILGDLFKFTGASGQGDPEIDMELGPNDQKIKVSGQLQLGLLKSNTDFYLGKDGMNFDSSFKIGDVYSAQLKGDTIKFTDFAKMPDPSQLALQILIKDNLNEGLRSDLDDVQNFLNRTVADMQRIAKSNDILHFLNNTFRVTDTFKFLSSLGSGVIEGGKLLVKSIGDILTIKEIYWKGSLADIKGGKVPAPLVKARILGKDQEIILDEFDLKNPLVSLNKGIEKIVNIAKKNFIGEISSRSALDAKKLIVDYVDLDEAL